MKWDVFVGNIEFSVTDELLVTIFSEVGRVIDIRMKQEGGRPAGTPKRGMLPLLKQLRRYLFLFNLNMISLPGYGFVEYGDPDTCRAAIALLDGRPLNGRPMKGWLVRVLQEKTCQRARTAKPIKMQLAE